MQFLSTRTSLEIIRATQVIQSQKHSRGLQRDREVEDVGAAVRIAHVQLTAPAVAGGGLLDVDLAAHGVRSHLRLDRAATARHHEAGCNDDTDRVSETDGQIEKASLSYCR